ncbi:MAG TPA: hypothetical protein VKX96_15230 [Chloroflexota bacterium]|nr:hypothetical protein [Chloroflexota bacterium]
MNLPLTLTGQIWHSYDFSTHVFFANHYERTWWSLWEPRWFGGFDVASYPPLTHQLTALLGWLIGIGNAVNVLTALAIVAFPIMIYRLGRHAFGRAVASRAAMLAVVTPSVLLAGYAFGQLPTLVAFDVGLWAGEAFGQFLRHGRRIDLLRLWLAAGVVVTAHHATFLFFFPPFLATLAGAALLEVGPKMLIVWRSVVAGIGLAVVVVVAILPFWVWHATEYVVQVPIDHQSRHNLLDDIIAQDLFFWGEHGILIGGLFVGGPLLRRHLRRFGPWFALAVFLVIMGLGGTTPLPRLLFGSQWAWLTYDRFSLWASVPLILLFAAAAGIGSRSLTWRGKMQGMAWWLTLGILALDSLVDAFVPALVQTEPRPIDPRPIVAFLEEGDHARWRYLTLGFGDQSGTLNAMTDAETLDGSYYTARRLPILTGSGIAQIDFSLLWDPKATVLREMLRSSASYRLRWVFTRDPLYVEILRESGWHERQELRNGVGVWETSVPIPPVQPVMARTSWLAVWWGIAPLAFLFGAIASQFFAVRRECRLPA